MSQVGSNFHPYQFFDCIINFRCDDQAIVKADGYNTNKRGKRKRRETTLGWHFTIKFKYGTKQWVLLSLIKE